MPHRQKGDGASHHGATRDVIIVGAGPAGIGMALALGDLPGLRLAVLESGDVGESFRRWPRQTRFITPSFDGHAFGLVDLNAVDASSSPADASGVEHLSGPQYADYLQSLVERHELPVMTGVRVDDVVPGDDGMFTLETSHGVRHARCVIWATGEFQFPDRRPFPGGETCVHYADVADWRALTGEAFTVIGGSESAIDATVNLIEQGHQVRLLTRQAPQARPTSRDPSETLSPYTRARFLAIADVERLTLVEGANIVKVWGSETAGYGIEDDGGRQWTSATAPILGTGFSGGAETIAALWDRDPQGRLKLSDSDESTRTPGLFLVGPEVSHAGQAFCFVYKFRQRFDIVRQRLIAHLGGVSKPSGQTRWELSS